MKAIIVSEGDAGSIAVRGDGTVLLKLGGSQTVLAPDLAIHVAEALLKAVAYVSDEIAKAAEGVHDVVFDTQKSVEALKEETDRFKDIGQ